MNCISTKIIVKNQGFSNYFTQTFTQKINLPTSSYSKKKLNNKTKKDDHYFEDLGFVTSLKIVGSP